jgi:hypothetical protein
MEGSSAVVKRSSMPEILDQSDIPEELASRSYRELTSIHRLLGNTRYIIRALKRDPLPVRSVLDVGCGRGGVLEKVIGALGVQGIGVDIQRPDSASFHILSVDAVCERLPEADVAYSTFLAHHLSSKDLIEVIRNVGRSCRRFILLDVVRSWVPLVLFQVSVAPLVSPITAADGQLSIRRAYTRRELRTLVLRALAGTNARFSHVVSPLGLRQAVDISYASRQT